MVVADENTKAYGAAALELLRAAGVEARLTLIPAGEAHKHVDTVKGLWGEIIDAGVDRGGTLVAVGGGVVGDLVGFTAATWMRGVRWVGVPTTLLAMVDSSLGGKTGFDLPQGKNLVGAFHPPALVLADTDTLLTLPREELLGGVSESIKHGIIGDPQLFAEFEAGEAEKWDPERVARSMAVKIGTIKTDPYERGVRAALNLGHTIGHALELASGFKLRHGEAVAIGMVKEALLAEKLGIAAEPRLAKRIKTALEKAGLPTSAPSELDRTAVSGAMRLDKKNRDGNIRFALPVKVGEVRVGVEVAFDHLNGELFADLF